jgi:hypothetical protein
MPRPKRIRRELARLLAEKQRREDAQRACPACGMRPADGMQAVDEDGIDTRTGKPGCEECCNRRGRIVFFMPESKPDNWPDSPYWVRYDSPADPTEDHDAAQSKLL